MNRKIALAAGLVTMGLTSLSANAGHISGFSLFDGQEFTFDGTAYTTPIVGLYEPTEFTATHIDFSYQADVDNTQVNATSSTFEENGVAFFSTFQNGLANPVGSFTSGLNVGGGFGYKLYGVFEATGDSVANGDGIDGTFQTFTLNIYIDDNEDTVIAPAGQGDPNETTGVSGATGDDVLILSGILDTGGFHVFSGLANGDFDVLFDITFFDPTVWGGLAFAGTELSGDLNGVNTSIVGIDPANPFGTTNDILIQGSGNAAFKSVPVPGVLGLLGAGLLGLGWVGRSRKHA